MILYNMPSSGNSYKVRLLLGLTSQSADCLDVEYGDVALEKAKAALPFGKAPVLMLDDGTALPESNAILWYLAQETALLAHHASGAGTDPVMDVLGAEPARRRHCRARGLANLSAPRSAGNA